MAGPPAGRATAMPAHAAANSAPAATVATAARDVPAIQADSGTWPSATTTVFVTRPSDSSHMPRRASCATHTGTPTSSSR